MRRLILFLSGALILAGAVFGNTNRSSEADARKVVVSGTVYDSHHAVIVFSQVLARSEMKDYRATTNDEGVYKLELPAASYRVEANAAGFCPRRVDLFRVSDVLMQRPLDFVLEVKDNDQPCKQKTMIEKETERRSELFVRIAE